MGSIPDMGWYVDHHGVGVPVGMGSIPDMGRYGEHAGQELVYGASRTGLV